jgi:DNA-3-methyladenine glycosylase I
MPDDLSRRCFGEGDPLYESYHDREWGRPVTDECGLFERLCLEGFQAGLSWITVLRKRPRFREVFLDFDPERVARMTERDVARLQKDAGIIRNRAKIEATVSNARAALALREDGTDLATFVWSFRPPESPAPATVGALPATTPASIALSKALRSSGFRFVGPTTAYALMQACGLVNDHVGSCPVRDEVQSERARVRLPGVLRTPGGG